MNFYKHHIGDYDADTAHLSWLEDAAYRRLMCLYYRREQPIPSDVAQACRLVRAVSKAEREAVETVLREFFVLGDEGWRNRRCDGEIDAAQAKATANRDNGKRGGRPRKTETQEKPSGFPVGSESHPTQNLLQTPDTRHQSNTPPPPKGEADPPGFAEFWEAWPQSPRKVGRKQAAAKWKRHGYGQKLTAILAHVQAMRQTKQWQDGFEPAPLTYLNQERWGDGVPQCDTETDELRALFARAE